MARRVGYAFQHADQQLFERTIRDDVAFGPRQLGLGTDHVDGLLAELGLQGARERHPYDLPAPLRKLVSLAGVLAMRTGVLVLDEPTAGFDRGLRARLVQVLRRRSAAGTTLVVITHDLALVAAVARREVVLEEGRIARDAARP
jgi:energy-coupling factor transport system ATP-binding protein